VLTALSIPTTVGRLGFWCRAKLIYPEKFSGLEIFFTEPGESRVAGNLQDTVVLLGFGKHYD